MLYILVVKYRLFGFQYSQNPYCGFPKTDYNIKVGLNLEFTPPRMVPLIYIFETVYQHRHLMSEVPTAPREFSTAMLVTRAKACFKYIYMGHHPRRSKFQIQTVPTLRTENMKMDKNFIENFRLPRYNEIPNVGLYLEQVIKYINECLEPLEICITPSMLSNYVKKGYIDRPVKKQYSADQIAYAMFIVIAKQTLSMENVASLFEYQKSTYSVERAYNFFCNELENMLKFIFEIEKEPPAMSGNEPFATKTLRSVVIAVSHIIYLNYCFKNKLN